MKYKLVQMKHVIRLEAETQGEAAGPRLGTRATRPQGEAAKYLEVALVVGPRVEVRATRDPMECTWALDVHVSTAR